MDITVVDEYVNAALRRAVVEKTEDNTWVAYVPEAKGVVAFGADIRELGGNLGKLLEEWAQNMLHGGYPLPALDGIDLNTEAGSGISDSLPGNLPPPMLLEP